jgi:creatinine deaminase
MTDDLRFMRLALEQARKSYAENGIPVGAVLVRDGAVLASGHNRRIQDQDPIAHGEMDCIRKAGRQKSLKDTVLYTTLCPCMMCSGTIVQFKIPRVVVGEAVNFNGAIPLPLDAMSARADRSVGGVKLDGTIPFLKTCGVQVVVMNDPDCIDLMKEFIERWPSLWNEDIGEG